MSIETVVKEELKPDKIINLNSIKNTIISVYDVINFKMGGSLSLFDVHHQLLLACILDTPFPFI